MLDRILNSKMFVSFLLASGTWFFLNFRHPFPADNLVLGYISVKDPLVYGGIRWSYTLMMFTTPYIIFSSLLSGIYIFAYRSGRRTKPIPLAPYPHPARNGSLALVIGEQHHPTQFVSSPAPRWITTPERGLYTGTIVIGAIGSGKTSCIMLPDADQLIGFQAQDPDRRIGGLVLEVKGDFCHHIRKVMNKYEREDDYIEISLDSDYR